MSISAERILIVGPAWVGDMIMAQALFMRLKAENPQRVLDVVAPKWTLPLLGRMPEVRRGIELAVGHGTFGWGIRKALGKSLRGQYDRAIVMPNTWKSALVPWFAQVPRRVGFRGEFRYGLLNDARRLDAERLPKMIQRYVSLGGEPEAELGDIPRPRLYAKDSEAVLQANGLQRPKGLLGLCPGAEYGPAKQWPASHCARLAESWLTAWPDAQVWIFGSGKDRDIGEAILQELMPELRNRMRNLAGETTLGEAIDLMALTSVVVSNDSGLMHVAAALDRPLVALFGSSTPNYTPPNGDPAKTESLWLGLPCSPCFKRTCPHGHLDCLQKIEPARVLEGVDRVVKA